MRPIAKAGFFFYIVSEAGGRGEVLYCSRRTYEFEWQAFEAGAVVSNMFYPLEQYPTAYPIVDYTQDIFSQTIGGIRHATVRDGVVDDMERQQ